MNKPLFIAIILIATFGVSQAYANSFNWSLCHPCIGQVQPYHGQYHPDRSQTSLNYKFDIHVPDHQDRYGLVVNSTDWVRINNDVGYFTIPTPVIQTTEQVNTQFCPLSNFIWKYETVDYQNDLLKKGLYDKVVPPDCAGITQPEPVPEFGHTMAIILAIVVMAAVVITAKTSFRFKA